MSYNFPEKNRHNAREVTELDFEIEPNDDTAYVDLDEVRGQTHLDEMKS